MCGRFTQHYTWAEIEAFLLVAGPPRNVQPRYNIAPTTAIDVVRKNRAGRRELVSMRWGLVPFFWKKPLREAPVAFNARAESIADKPMFREPFQRRRCIIPASGFYEWTGPRKERQPHYFTSADGAPIVAFAGLWDVWRDPQSDETIQSCTILVTSASPWVAQFHDRMPVILPVSRHQSWLDGSAGADALISAPEDRLREWPVSPRVNSSAIGDDDPTVIEPQPAVAGDRLL